MKRAAWLALIVILLISRVYALDALPPGIHYDAASNGVYALNIVFNNARPFFINHMGAPEPLIVYLQAITVWMFGTTVFALRLVTTLSGALSVAALFACANEFVHDRRVALVAAFALAVSAPLIDLSRLGLRFALVPLFETALLFFAWRGWRDGAHRDWVLAGIVLGLSVYTYIAALMLPALLFVLWVHQFITARTLWRSRLTSSAAIVAVSAFVAAPRLIFQIQYPASALLRASQVSLLQNPAVQSAGLLNVILARLLTYAKMFGIEWQGGSFNLPLLDPFLFALFLLGLAVCLARWKDIRWSWAPLTILVMLVPDLLGANEPSPNKLRTIGIIPPTFFLVGVGAIYTLDLFKRRARAYPFAAAGLAIVLIASAARGLDAYFSISPWAMPLNRELDGFNTNLPEIAEGMWIARHAEPVYVPLNEYTRSPVHFITGARAPHLRSALRADGTLDPRVAVSRAWVILPVDESRPRTEGLIYVYDPAAYVLVAGDTVFLLPPTRPDAPSVETQLAAQRPADSIRDDHGTLVANAYAIDSSSNPFQFALIPSKSTSAKFSEGFDLIGASVEADHVQPGGVVPLSLYWQTTKPSADYTVFVHLLDLNGNVASNADVLPGAAAYQTSLWTPDEIVPTHHSIRVPLRTLPGKYSIEIGLSNILSQTRLDVLDARGNAVDSRVIVGAVKVAPRATSAYNPSHSQSANFDQRIALEGYDVPAGKPGEALPVTLGWRAQQTMDHDYTVFVHVLDASGAIVAQSDHQPQAGRYPTSIWDAGEAVRDDFTVNLPANLPEGKYNIEIGWYDLKTSQRLPVRDANNQSIGDSVILDAPLEVAR